MDRFFASGESLGKQVLESISEVSPLTVKVKPELDTTSLGKEVMKTIESLKPQSVKIKPEFVGSADSVGKEVMRTVLSLHDEIDKINGKPIDIDASQARAQVESLSTTFEETKTKLQGVIDEATRLGRAIGEADTSWITNEKMELTELKETYQQLREEKKSMDEKFHNSTAGMSENELQEYAQILASMTKIAEMLHGGRDFETPGGIAIEPKQAEQEFNSLAELKQAIDETKGELDALRQKARSGDLVDFDKTVEEAKVLESSLKRLEGMRKALEGDGKEKPIVPPVPEQEVSEFQTLVNTSHSLKGAFAGINGANVVSALKSVEKYAIKAGKSIISGIVAGLKLLASGAKLAVSALANLIGAGFNALKAVASQTFGVLKNFVSAGLNGIKTAISGVMGAIGNLSRSGFNALSSTVSQTFSNMKRLASGGFNAVRTGVGAVKSGLESMRKAMHSIVRKATPNMMKSFSSLKSMLMRRIKRTFISAIFNQAKEGIQSLAKYSSSFNKAMSAIKNSAKESAGNLSVTMGNLVETIAPAIQTLLGWFNQLLVAINTVFALLQGKKSVAVAKQGTDDYAKSLKKAGGAAKDLNHQLYGFDELTRQEDNNGGGGGSSGVEFTEQEFTDGISDFATRLVEAFKAGKFEEVGAMVGNALSDIIKKIDDWVKKMRSKAKKWASNIARILNGLIDTDLFENMGELLGDGLNLAFDAVNTFFNTFNFDVFGKKLADGVNKIFNTVEWDLVGNTFASYFNSIAQTVSNFFAKAKWGEWGKKLATGVSSFFGAIDWKAHENVVKNGINGIVDLLSNFVNNVPWASVAKKFRDSLVNVVNGIDWNNIASLLSSGTNKLIEVFHVFAQGEFLKNLGTKLGGTFSKAISEINWETLAQDIVIGLASIRTAIFNFVNEFDIGSIATRFANAINGIFTDSNVQKAWKEGQDSAVNGINNVIDGFANFVKTIDLGLIATTLATNISELFNGIDWGTLVTTALKGMMKIGDAILKFFENLDLSPAVTGFTNGVKGFFDSIKWKDLGENVGTRLMNIVKNIKVSDITSALTKVFNSIISFATGLIGSIKWGDVASTINSGLTDLIDNQIDWNGIKELLSTMISAVQEVFHELANSDFFIDLAGKVGGVVGGLLNDIDWDGLVIDIGMGLAKLKEAFWTFVSSLNIPNIASNLAGAINGLFTDENVTKAWDEADEKAIAGIGSIVDAFGEFVTKIDALNIATKLGERVSKILQGISFTALADNARVGLQKIADAFTGFVTGLDLPTIASNLADGVNKFFDPKDTPNFGTIASRVAEGVNQIIAGFKTFVAQINFDSIRESLKNGINNLLYGTDWDGLLTTIGQGVLDASTAFFKLASDVFSPQDGESLGDKLSKGLNGIFQDENGELDTSRFQELGKSFGDAIKKVLSNINDFFTKTDWGDIGSCIGEALGNIDWLGIAGSLIQLLWNGLIGAVNLVGGLVGSFIRKLFGIENVDAFDATGVQWAQQLAESIRKGATASTTEQQIALTASAYATGLVDGFISELDTKQQDINTDVQSVAHEMVQAIADYMDDPEEISIASDRLGSALGIASNKAAEILKSGALNNLTYEDIMSELYNAKNGDDVVKFFEELGVSIPPAIASGLSQASPTVADKAKALMANLQNAQTLEEAQAYFNQAGLSVGDAFASAIAGEATENIASALMLLGQGVDEATITALDTSNLSANLEKYMQESGASITDVVAGLMYESGKTIEEIEKQLGMDAGTLIAENIPKGVAEGLGASEASLKEASEKAKNSAKFTEEDNKELNESGQTAGKQTGEGFAEEVENNKENVVNKVDEVKSAVTEKYEALPDEVKPYAEQLMEYIATAFADGDGTVKTAIETVAQSAVDRAKEILNSDAGLDIATTFLNGIKDTFEKDTTVKDACKVLIEGIKTAFEDDTIVNGSNGAMVTYAKDLVKLFSDQLTETEGKKLGGAFISGISSGMNDEYTGNLQYEAEDVAESTYYTLEGGFNYDNGYWLSYYIMDGLANGLSQNKNAVVKWAASIANDLVATFKSKLGIASPSKVFAQLGMYTMEGMQEGLESTGKSAVDTVADIANAIIEEAENGDNVQMTIGTMTDGLDTAIDKMTRLSQIFSDIASTIVEMGGLEIPTVATGKVIPYHARVDTSTPTETSAINEAGLEDAIYSAFRRAMGNENNQQPIEVKLVVDGRTLADIVTKNQRDQQRAWGV